MAGWLGFSGGAYNGGMPLLKWIAKEVKMAISFIDVLTFIKDLISDGDKLAKFKEVIEDVKELINDIKAVVELIKK